MRPFSRTFASRISEVSSWTLMFATALLLLQAIFQSPRLIESSSVAYATDLRGTDRGALLVPGADAIDWEDISLGPCPKSIASTCLYLADTGDNLEFRPFVTIYAVPEPAPPERASDTSRTTSRRSTSRHATRRCTSSARARRAGARFASHRPGTIDTNKCALSREQGN